MGILLISPYLAVPTYDLSLVAAIRKVAILVIVFVLHQAQMGSVDAAKILILR